MGLFDLFKKKAEAPLGRYDDEFLGPLVWSDDDEAWAGERGDVRFLLGYGGRAVPQPEVLAYAREVLTDYHLFESALRWAKRDIAAELPWLGEEIEALRVETIYFDVNAKGRWMFVSLEGGQGDRAWFAEFRGWNCDGISFDT